MVYGLVSVLCVIAVVQGVKLYLLKKSVREITVAFADRLQTDTNTLIDISGRDRDMCRLTDAINRQLKILRREHHRYQQGDAELKNAVMNISHDLRTPLTAICGYLELLAQTDAREDMERYISIISERTEFMKGLTEELFLYSVILSADHNEELEDVYVNQVLEESITGYYAALYEHGIQPNIEITEVRVERRMNRASLSRVFANLISNAIKYSDGDLEIRMLEDGRITFANMVKGLTSVQVEQLFDRFYTVSTASHSTGLGLAIARTLVERMGGTMSAVYEGERLTITIRL